MKVVHLTSVHFPFDTRVFYRECAALKEAGYEVVLIAPHEKDDVVNGIRLQAVPKPRTRVARLLLTGGRVFRKALAENAPIYHFHDPELIPFGILLRLCGKRVVYDVHEDYSRQILSKTWIPVVLRRLVSVATAATEFVAVRFFSAIVAATPVIAKRFPAKKTITVQNFPIPSELEASHHLPYDSRPHVAAYVGGISAPRGVREMVEAIRLLPEELNARLSLAGHFISTALEREVRLLPGAARTDILGRQTRDGVRDILANARVGLVTLHPLSNYIDAQPVKLFEYMAAGLPVIASDFPRWRALIEESKCGLLVDPMCPAAIAEAIRWILDNPAEAEAMGLRGQEAMHKKYCWTSEAAALVDLYSKLLNSSKKTALVAGIDENSPLAATTDTISAKG